MSPEVEAMMSKPLTAETMNTDGALRLLADVFRYLRKDYIHGKLTLLRCYGRDMTEKEFNEIPMKTEGHNSRLIRLYYDAMRTVRRDYFGVADSVLPEDIFAVWDAEVQKHLAKKSKKVEEDECYGEW